MARVLIDMTKPVDPQLEALAEAARLRAGEDWEGDRRLAAMDNFMTVVEELMHPMAWDEFANWCLGATEDAMIDEALRLLREE